METDDLRRRHGVGTMDFGIILLFLVFFLLSPFLFLKAAILASYEIGENARSVFKRAIVAVAVHLAISFVVGFLLLIFVVGPEPRGPETAMTYPERAFSYAVALVYGAIVYLLCCSIPMKLNLLFRRNEEDEASILKL